MLPNIWANLCVQNSAILKFPSKWWFQGVSLPSSFENPRNVHIQGPSSNTSNSHELTGLAVNRAKRCTSLKTLRQLLVVAIFLREKQKAQNAPGKTRTRDEKYKSEKHKKSKTETSHWLKCFWLQVFLFLSVCFVLLSCFLHYYYFLVFAHFGCLVCP